MVGPSQQSDDRNWNPTPFVCVANERAGKKRKLMTTAQDDLRKALNATAKRTDYLVNFNKQLIIVFILLWEALRGVAFNISTRPLLWLR